MSRQRVLATIAALLLVTAVLIWASLSASNDRRWATEQSLLPQAEFSGHEVLIHGVRNFRWTADTAPVAAWEDRRFDLDGVATAWYVLAPFSRAWRGPAHAFVSFGFDDGRYLSISVEARREQGEAYGVLQGILRRYELMYVVGDERDLIGRRAGRAGSDVYLYPVRAERADIRRMFTEMLVRANRLREHPEWYNSFTNNCTMNIIRHVNAIAPGRIPSSWRIALPGYSDEVVHRLGLIDSTVSLEAGRVRYRINDRATAALDAPDFSARIREP